MPARASDPLLDAVHYSREEFLDRYWDYEPGQHVTILGPTRDGKTQLAFDLLDRTATPQLPFAALVCKPNGGDATVARYARKFKVKTVRDWPPPLPLPFTKPRRGVVVWPKYNTKQLDWTEWNQHRVFETCMADAFDKRNRIIFADELAWIAKELGLARRTSHIHMQGGGLGVGLWACSQRPVDIPRHAYSQAEHMFMSRDRDRDSRKRYTEIGGVEPHLIYHNLDRLRKYEWLYIKRTAPDDALTNDSPMCIIGK